MIRSDVIDSCQPRPRLRFTVDDYYEMIEIGMIKDYERSEIIDGEMVPKMTIGDRRAIAVDLLNRILVRSLPDSYRIGVQNPLRVGDFDEPEPDFVISDLSLYDGKRHPTPAEVILIIEVSDTSLKQDRDTKLPMYANANIAEVWIVNLQHNVIEVHQDPALDIYQQVKIFRPGEQVRSSVLPQLGLDVESVIS